MRNDWGRECLEAYHRIIPKSEPVEDWEKRIQLYALCVQFSLLTPYPLPPSYTHIDHQIARMEKGEVLLLTNDDIYTVQKRTIPRLRVLP